MKRYKKLFEKENLKENSLSWHKMGRRLTYIENVRVLNESYDAYNSGVIEKAFPGLKFRGGRFEQWLEKVGVKLTSNDVRQMQPEDAGSLLNNIFYSPRGLTKMISNKLVWELIEKSMEDPEMGAHDLDAIQYLSTRGNLGQEIYNAYWDEEIHGDYVQ